MKEETTKEFTPRFNRWDLFRVFLRSFFMQSVWNFRSLLSVGFSVCLFPVIKKLYPDLESKRRFFLRHLSFFNAHPYLASYALGVAIRLEEEAARGEEHAWEMLERVKGLLIGPLGATGDRLFWGTIKPATLIFAMTGVFIAPTLSLKIAVLIIAFFLYNIPHFYFRFHGIVEGYQRGIEVYKVVSQQRFEKLRRVYALLLICSFLTLVMDYAFSLGKENGTILLALFLTVGYTLVLKRIYDNFYLLSAATVFFMVLFGILLI